MSAEALPIATTPRSSVAHAWLTAAVYADLEREAAARRMHPDAFAARILETFLSQGFLDSNEI